MTAAGVGALLGGIAALLWPLLLVVVVLVLRRQIRDIANSVGRRGGSVKLAGFEVTIAEATAQQQSLIADLQVQLGGLHDRVVAGSELAGTSPPIEAPRVPPVDRAPSDPLPPVAAPDATPIPGAFADVVPSAIVAGRAPPVNLSVLWVDGHPESSAALQAAIIAWGVRLTNVPSVAAALDYVTAHEGAVVVTRMNVGGEGGAAIDLAARARSIDPLVTVAVFGTPQGIARRGAEALAAGAAFVTASPAELIRFLARVVPKA